MSFAGSSDTYVAPDPLLMPYVQAFMAKDETRLRDCLDTLIHDHADPIISAAVSRYVVGSASASQDPADVRGETVLRLLRRLKPAPPADSEWTCNIGDFRAYVKLTARHVCWNQATKVRCERSMSSFYASSDDADYLTETPPYVDLNIPSRTDVMLHVIDREHLREIWKEVILLPLKQRRALLFNFHGPDGNEGLSALANAIGLDRRDIAAALNVSEEVLSALMALMPMENHVVGSWLSLSTLEVANLRTAARRRMQRRLRNWCLDECSDA